MCCSHVPVKDPLEDEAVYLNLAEGLEENVLSIQESLRGEYGRFTLVFFFPV